MEERKIILRELMKQSPADIAEILVDLSQNQATDLIHRLFLRNAAAEPLGEMDPDDSAELVVQLDRKEASEILSRMDPDDAADLLFELSDDIQQELLSRLSRSDAKVLSDLLAYPPDSAGGLMSPEVVPLSLTMTVQDAIHHLRSRVKDAETVYYAYAVDDENRLLGVLSLRDMALADPSRSLRDLVIRDAISVPVDADAEDVAHIFDKYNYFALPVVNSENKLLGVITFDDVIDVIREEATEDIYGLAGVPSEEGVDTTWAQSLKLRLPWLYVRLLTALAAAAVVGLFEVAIAKVAALAVLMGIIAGQGGSAGMQTVTIITRGMALGELDRSLGWRLLGKETLLGVANGVLIGATVGVITYLWKGQILMGIAVFLAMALNMIIAGACGVAIPLFVRKLGKDPALVSGIFLTTVTDMLGFGLMFAIAIWLLPEI
ncbi:magnesium transporter [Candidatus Bipolaricaulota bacterium]|nr:magnesium transporter [Candidatus Bipolaricaulota bacterium]TFH09376.1 MAG: magnesium transporter [Candidatus Atribacteria bacterium]